jgi:phosphodiesterase/alkaline phosphatase D-like protein
MNKKPELLFMIGDNVYPDKGLGYNKATPPETLWSRYVETRNTLEIYFAQELIPIIATWDDHDYGINDGDRKYPYKEESKKTFFSFFAQEQSEGTTYESSGLGVASLLKGFGFQFYLMDDRYFRSAPQEANTETHWGIEQENWLNSHLKQDKSPAWILNGDQFFGAYHKFESYEGRHPENFKKLLGQWKNLKTPLVLLSGDRHLAELMAISKKEFGQNTFEITSSAIHAKTFPDAWKDSPNPRQMAGASGFFNYAVIEATSKPKFSFDVTAYGPEEKVLFEKKNLKVTF